MCLILETWRYVPIFPVNGTGQSAGTSQTMGWQRRKQVKRTILQTDAIDYFSLAEVKNFCNLGNTLSTDDDVSEIEYLLIKIINPELVISRCQKLLLFCQLIYWEIYNIKGGRIRICYICEKKTDTRNYILRKNVAERTYENLLFM